VQEDDDSVTQQAYGEQTTEEPKTPPQEPAHGENDEYSDLTHGETDEEHDEPSLKNHKRTRSQVSPRTEKGEQKRRFIGTVNITRQIEPSTYAAAMRSEEAEEWQTAFEEEHQSMLTNEVWDVVDRPTY